MYLPTENLMVHSLKSISSCMLFGLKPTVVQETYMQLACPLLALRWSWNKYPLSMLGTAVLLFYPSIWQARTDINRPCLLKMNAVELCYKQHFLTYSGVMQVCILYLIMYSVGPGVSSCPFQGNKRTMDFHVLYVKPFKKSLGTKF